MANDAIDVRDLFPLPFVCLHEAYDAQNTTRDAHRNVKMVWKAPEERACAWWVPESHETAHDPIGGQRVAVSLVLVLDSSVEVDHRDRFTINGQSFEMLGRSQDFDHGPFGLVPGRSVNNLKWVG